MTWIGGQIGLLRTAGVTRTDTKVDGQTGLLRTTTRVGRQTGLLGMAWVTRMAAGVTERATRSREILAGL
jgi:hypothetical protein